MWAQSVQVEPLVRYVSRSLRADQPLELAGIDLQIFSAELPRDLREFFRSNNIVTPLSSPDSPELQIR
jgi:hypothetical protein